MAHKKSLLEIVGARPNFIKMAPLHEALLQSKKYEVTLLHTGQHYDFQMSQIFFDQLDIPNPDIHLNISGNTQTEQTACMMIELEKQFLKHNPDYTIVFGDINSTLAASLVCSKLGIPLIHIESGLRSFDMSMPEEVNRIVTDRLSSHLFTTEPSAYHNLTAEGIKPDKIHFCGNTMIDTLVKFQDLAKGLKVFERFGRRAKDYILLTFHRPSNVDERGPLKKILDKIIELSKDFNFIFPLHPRTKKSMEKFSLYEDINQNEAITLIEPLGYLDFLSLMSEAACIMTDSGGIQEESTYLKVPCFTLRENTERPVTMSKGSNQLIKDISELNVDFIKNKIETKYETTPELWDGFASSRILKTLNDIL